jgi:ATP-dependent Clp protease ATP-binding subunit ClpC
MGDEIPVGELPLTVAARQVLHHARREADLYQAEKIQPEHLLLGILREGEGLASQVLVALHVDLGRVRANAIAHPD